MRLLAPTLGRVRRELAIQSLAEFVKQSWHVIEPGTPLVWNWHLDVICDHVQALVEGRLGKQNLIINVPPGSMKSTILSVCLPAWRWASDPSWRGLFVSGSEGIAIRDSIKCRDIIDSEWYQQTFTPEWSFARDQNAKGHYKNTATGFRKAISAGARITGERGHIIVVDDPNDAAEAFSKPARDSIIQWWDNAAANRLLNLSTGHRVIIQQRLHGQDLTGHIQSTDKQDWDFLIIRQEWEPPQPTDPDFHPTSLGWVDPRTVEGDLFFPQRFPPTVVEGEKRRLASSGYAGQHQQRPTPAEGAIFKKGFIKRYRVGAEPRFSRIILTADTAFKEKEENDYTVVFAIGEAENGFYFLARAKGRMGYPEMKQKVRDMGESYRPTGLLTAFLIEDAASGQSLIQELKADTTLPVVPVRPDGDKVSRANSVVPSYEAGNWFLPEGEGADWVDDFLNQLYGFPKMAHDDDVDSAVQGVKYLNLGGGNTGMLDWLRSEAEALKKPNKSIEEQES